LHWQYVADQAYNVMIDHRLRPVLGTRNTVLTVLVWYIHFCQWHRPPA
jgi:hypothetical protein